MNVLIVAKTKVGSSICVGALDGNGVSLRLHDKNWQFPPANAPYQVGQIWDMTLMAAPAPQPPHLEDVAVLSEQYRANIPDVSEYLRQHIVPWTGSVTTLFEGHLGFTSNKRGYIEAPNLPSRSTWFWIPDHDLHHVDYGGKAYYRYGTYELSYVGIDPVIPKIPANALVRVSLARWWRPANADASFPERCYLQLSGWYL